MPASEPSITCATSKVPTSAGSARSKRRGDPAHVHRLVERERDHAHRPRAEQAQRRKVQLHQRHAVRRRPGLIGMPEGHHRDLVARRQPLAELTQDEARSVQRGPRRLRRADEDAHRGHVGSMCGLRATKSAVVISPLLPEPPVTGGQKRTLRLLEAIERAGLTPHVLTPTRSAGRRAAAARPGLGRRDPSRAAAGPARPRAPAPRAASESTTEERWRPVRRTRAGRGARAVRAHAERVLRGPKGVPSVLSLHNIDSAMARPFIRGARVSRRRASRLSRGWIASCASPRPTPPRYAPGAGTRCWRPTASTTRSSTSRDPARERCSSAPWTTGRTAAGSSASLPRVARRPAGAPRSAPAGRGSRERAVRGRARRGRGPARPARHGAAVVVPIWEGGGTRLKVLEALASGRAVVSTPLGAEGIGFEHGRHGVLAETP